MRNYLTERIMKKEYYEGAGECPECMDKLPVNTEKEREEKKKILRRKLQGRGSPSGGRILQIPGRRRKFQ